MSPPVFCPLSYPRPSCFLGPPDLAWSPEPSCFPDLLSPSSLVLPRPAQSLVYQSLLGPPDLRAYSTCSIPRPAHLVRFPGPSRFLVLPRSLVPFLGCLLACPVGLLYLAARCQTTDGLLCIYSALLLLLDLLDISTSHLLIPLMR